MNLNAIRAADDAFNYGTDQWDLIVFMYEPFPMTLGKLGVERLRKSLKSWRADRDREHWRRGHDTPTDRRRRSIPDSCLRRSRIFVYCTSEDTMAVPDCRPRVKRGVLSAWSRKAPVTSKLECIGFPFARRLRVRCVLTCHIWYMYVVCGVSRSTAASTSSSIRRRGRSSGGTRSGRTLAMLSDHRASSNPGL